MSTPFVWFDLTTRGADADRVREFYAGMFGWSIAPFAGDGPYRALMTDDGRPWAAAVVVDPEADRTWVPYVRVDDLNVATSRAAELGARVVTPATHGPAGTSVTIADPGGAPVALWVPFASTGTD